MKNLIDLFGICFNEVGALIGIILIAVALVYGFMSVLKFYYDRQWEKRCRKQLRIEGEYCDACGIAFCEPGRCPLCCDYIFSPGTEECEFCSNRFQCGGEFE